MTILVTGGAGFIGSNLLHHLIDVVDEQIICVDNLTYAADYNQIKELFIKFYATDIADEHNCEYIFKKHKPKTIFHLAAESHVDNSIKDCSQFIHTNILGTVNLLKLSLKYEVDRFMHISTDEVYGTIEEDSFTEHSNYNPRNPYSASKASSDHFVRAFHNTYGLPAIITNCSNNYGPRQYKEKLIPQTILNLLEGKKIPVYGDGKQVRDWLYVQDHCEALVEVWSRGRVGQKYNIGGECEVKNIDLVRMILSYLNMQEDMIEYVEDRPGHDRRYSTSISKVRHEIKWAPRFTLEQGLEKTIKWYESNRN
jgi:dTDP-glucose 4,6-dehydratase